MTTVLEAIDLTCGYGSRAVLSGVNLSLRAGEVLALIGPNGGGKTTLLHTLDRLIRPQRGDVFLEGKSIWAKSSREVARALALAPQRTTQAVWPLTVREAVELGRAPRRGWLLPYSTEDRAAVGAAMSRMGVAALAERSLSTLSGGETRRVLLARALAQAPRALLLDEPATYLDLHYQAELLGLMRALARDDGMAVVWTVHDLALAALCADRVALIADGGIKAIGTPTEVLRMEILAPVYGERVEIVTHSRTGAPIVLPRAS